MHLPEAPRGRTDDRFLSSVNASCLYRGMTDHQKAMVRPTSLRKPRRAAHSLGEREFHAAFRSGSARCTVGRNMSYN
jgi:hypothetical protein